MRIALDTNILAYAEGVNGVPMKQQAMELLNQLPQDSIFLPVQTLGELFNVLTRKAGRTRANAREAILIWSDAFPLIETSPPIFLAAMQLATVQQLGIWDSIILAAAAEAGCRLVLSQDLQEGFTWNGVTVTNPFLPIRNPLLSAMLEDPTPPQ